MCHVLDGKPLAESPEDYIHLGDISTINQVVERQLIESVAHFIETHVGEPISISDAPQVWKTAIQAFGKMIAMLYAHDIVEDVEKLAPDAIIGGRAMLHDFKLEKITGQPSRVFGQHKEEVWPR